MLTIITLFLIFLASPPLISSSSPPPPPTSPSGYRSTLTHINSNAGLTFTRSELMRRAAHRMLSATSSDAGPARMRSGQAEYLMEMAIGTPPVPFVALADTGSDLTWTQCQPCKLCFAQDTPIYDTAASSTFSAVPCSSATCLPIWQSRPNCTASAPCRYRYAYGDGAYSAGVLGTETLTFGSSASAPGISIGGIAFGCGVDNGGLSYNSTGTVGLGRGSLSLVAQLGVGKFSYCLTDFFNTSLRSPVLFGSLAELAAGDNGAAAAVQSTPLVQSPYSPSRYYVSLEGISLGDTLLPIPNGTFHLRAGDGSGGMIVDSGTIFTVLVEPGFRVVVDHVAAVLGEPAAAVNASSLDRPCFPAPAGELELPEMPDMVLHFAGGGADMRLSRDNYMSFDEEQESFCLNIVGAAAQYGSVLGNFQQQNIQMLFDITVGRLSWVPTDCSKL